MVILCGFPARARAAGWSRRIPANPFSAPSPATAAAAIRWSCRVPVIKALPLQPTAPRCMSWAAVLLVLPLLPKAGVNSAPSFPFLALSVACSANGKIIYALSGSTIYKSTNNFSTSPTTVGSGAGSISCTAELSLLFTANIACSGNGTYVAKLSGGGVITVSTNGGSTFSSIATAPAAGLSCLAVSSDRTRLVAGATNGLLYASANQGATWTALVTTSNNWSGAWMSADGSKLAATVSGVTGGLYYSSVIAQPNTVSTNSSICGSQGSAVELQYIGNGQFIPVSSSGLIWSN